MQMCSRLPPIDKEEEEEEEEGEDGATEEEEVRSRSSLFPM